MRIVGIILGVLLILFGGGCTALFFGVSVAEGSDTAQLWQMWAMFGVIPLAAGLLIIYMLKKKT